MVPAIVNTTMPSHPLNNIVDPDSVGSDNGGITGKQLYETLCRHSLFVNAVELDFHILASSVINVNARANFCVRVILKLEPRGICIFQTIFCMSDIVDYFVEK